MLVGREREQAEIRRRLRAARSGRGGALLVTGEAGIGKSALLDAAAAHAAGLRVLRADGVAAETALAYATLHHLLHPLTGLLGTLPGPQAHALRTAFGLQHDTTHQPPDRFLASVATLTLLSEAAAERGLLCLVDDLHWADAPSREVLAFVARRLDTEPVALLAAARDGLLERGPDGQGPTSATGQPPMPGVPALHLTGLDPDSAGTLLTRHRGLRLPDHARDRLVQATGGNPLALLELPATAATQPPGTDGLPTQPLPLARTLEQAFLDRVRQHPRAVQDLLLLTAADGTGQLHTIRAAARHLHLDPDLLEDAPPQGGPPEGGPLEDGNQPPVPGRLRDLVSVRGQTVTFRHPLVRSAVYHGATPARRRAAHRALAQALTPPATDEAADRRAWHHAHAADGPDEQVAAELERAAGRALRRAGHLAAAATLEHAAALSPTTDGHAQRLTGAAWAAWHGGDTLRARALLDRAERAGPASPAVQLDQRALRGLIQLRAGVPADAVTILLPAARDAAKTDPSRAMRLLVHASEATFDAGQTQAWQEVGEIIAALPPTLDPPDALLARLYLAVAAGPADPPAVRADLDQALGLDDPDLLIRVGGLAWGLNEYETARRLRLKGIELARAHGAAGTLAFALRDLTRDELTRGRLASAEAYAQEGLALADETGQPVPACAHRGNLAEIAALRGRAQEAEALAERVLAEAAQRHLASAAIAARRALADLALAAGNPEVALRHLQALLRAGPPGHRGLSLFAIADLAEASVRARQDLPDLPATVERLSAWAATTGSAEARALTARARALLTDGKDAEACFADALAFATAADRPHDRARTELLYGEFLRRGRRRADARPHLREALETFERLGTPIWAERARAELRATAETVRRRPPDGLAQLTPQELQIVRAVTQGATNREVAAQLFLSPRTVDYHLRKVFRTLGITSRAELVRVAMTSEVLGDGDHTGR